MILSNLPGLNKALSSNSILLVAAMTLMPSLEEKPSISESSCIRVRCTSLSPEVVESSLLLPIASISSMKMIDGDLSRAMSNNSLTSLPPSPMYFWASSDPTIPRKVALVEFASAFASIVFPLPGGPESKTPRGGSIPNLSNASGFVSGNSAASLREDICLSRPPSIENSTSGFSMISDAATSGSHPSFSTSMMDSVSWFRVTLAPGTRVLASNLGL